MSKKKTKEHWQEAAAWQKKGTSTTKAIADPELSSCERVFVPDARRVTREQARHLLGVRFSQGDIDRINELSAKADEGSLESREEVELERYVPVGHRLSILKAKIRGRLKKKAS